MKIRFNSVLIILALSFSAFAHEGHHHASKTTQEKEAAAADNVRVVYAEINKDYESTIKPIFDSKCAACHSLSAPAPWYASIPGVHWLIEKDRNEAKKHLEISNGFPFAGHGTPDEDLSAIKKTTDEGSMPTALYVFAHRSSRLTGEEKKIIVSWIDRSKEKLATATATATKTEKETE